jgi:hypothetical protein
MPTQKDLKRIVRDRMKKTGEAYTAARQHIVKKTQEPQRDYAAIAGMSDASVRKQTGRDWKDWVKTLDAARAAEKPHREIAAYVHSLGTPDWWTQMVTVGYERIRGLRERGQRRDGLYEANKSRTFAVPVAELFAAFTNARKRAKWLGVPARVRSKNPSKAMRITMEDGTDVVIGFLAKGPQKSSVAIQHQKLSTKDAATRQKQWWGERFDALSELLA